MLSHKAPGKSQSQSTLPLCSSGMLCDSLTRSPHVHRPQEPQCRRAGGAPVRPGAGGRGRRAGGPPRGGALVQGPRGQGQGRARHTCTQRETGVHGRPRRLTLGSREQVCGPQIQATSRKALSPASRGPGSRGRGHQGRLRSSWQPAWKGSTRQSTASPTASASPGEGSRSQVMTFGCSTALGRATQAERGATVTGVKPPHSRGDCNLCQPQVHQLGWSQWACLSPRTQTCWTPEATGPKPEPLGPPGPPRTFRPGRSGRSGLQPTMHPS